MTGKHRVDAMFGLGRLGQIRSSEQHLIGGIELGMADNQDSHLADRTVNDTGWDGDRGQGRDRCRNAIEFDGRVRTALQDHVDLGVMRVMVWMGSGIDIRQMHGTGELGEVTQGPTSRSARAGHR